MNEVNQKFQIEVDGELKDAEILKIVTVDASEYAIYSIDKGDETSDVLASRIVKDDEGHDNLVDLETVEEKKRLTEIVQAMFS